MVRSLPVFALALVGCRTPARSVNEAAMVPVKASVVASAPQVAPPPRITFRTTNTPKPFLDVVTIPQIAFDDVKVQRGVAAAIDVAVKRDRAQFAKDLRDIQADSPGQPIMAMHALSCAVPYASNELVSIGCDTYAFTGGAHGTKGYVAINLELPSLRRLTLDDFVRRDPKSRAKLRELANASSSFEGFDDVKLDTFVVTDAGLRFELKDQLPFAVADAIEPQVSWSALSPILVRPWTPSAAHASAAAPHTVWDARADADL